MTRDEAFGVIVQVLEQEHGIDPNMVSFSTLLNRDLGIEGDDAVALIQSIERRLGVRPSLNFREYFAGEGLFIRHQTPLPVSKLIESIMSDSGSPN